MDIGQSFGPANQPMAQPGQVGQRSANPVMDAIKILSFRIPQTVGPAPAPQSLLAGAGGVSPGMGGDNSALIQQWLQRFFGNALGPMGNAPPNAPPNAATPGSSVPGAITPSTPGQVSIQFPQAPLPGRGLPGPTWGDMGGAQRSMGPAQMPQIQMPQMPMGGGVSR